MTRSWLFSSGQESVQDTFDVSGRIEMADGPYRGFLEHRPVIEGLSVFRAEGRGEASYTMEASNEQPSDNLILGCVLSGTGVLEAEGNADQVWRDAGQNYVLTLSRRQVRYHLQPGVPFRSVALMLTPEAVDRVARDHDLPELTRLTLQAGAPLAAMRPISPHARRVAEELLDPVYTGRMAALYREAKAAELLALHVDQLIEATDHRAGLTSGELRRVREARERLLADLRDPPGLDELAASVGLTPKRLNKGFRSLFGTTVFDYLAEARLQMAREMIEGGLDLPLKLVAWQLGYNQASNFINAYRRRFGMSPGAHRRSRGGR